MRLFLRILGVWFLLIAMIAVVVDATKTLAANGTLVITPFGEEWKSLNASSLTAAKTAVEAHGGTAAWTIIDRGLAIPTWAIFGLLGLALYWLGQKRRRSEVFIN